MTLRFDDALPQTLTTLENSPLAQDLTEVTIIRDLQGKVRLILEFPDTWSPNQTHISALEQTLANKLGVYWGKKIWSIKLKKNDLTLIGSKERPTAFQAMYQTVKNDRQLWYPPNRSPQFNYRLYKLERLFSKSSWQPNKLEPPWPSTDLTKPAIISFFSFKGGVGRTTTTAAIAILLARAGKRVMVLDLDLEAPGIGSLLLDPIPLPDTGLIDYLLESQLTQSQPDLTSHVAVQTAQEIIGNGKPLRIMTAGKVNPNFLEKLARLDFEGFFKENPLVKLLHHINNEYELDFILLDLRSGLHDLGGLSLNGLSHLDILFGFETEQSWAGLEVVLNVLGGLTRREVLLIHAMNPLSEIDPQQQTSERFRNRGYDLFKENYYAVNETMPSLTDEPDNYGFPLSYESSLTNLSRLTPAAINIFTDINKNYVKLARLIGTFLGRDTI